MTSPSSYTDAQVEEWASVQKMVYELVRGVAAVVDTAGTDRADATAFAEFRKALQRFLVPQIYDRASVEGVVRNIGKEQRPMLEFLISLMEQDQDEDLAGLAQASRGASWTSWRWTDTGTERSPRHSEVPRRVWTRPSRRDRMSD